MILLSSALTITPRGPPFSFLFIMFIIRLAQDQFKTFKHLCYFFVLLSGTGQFNSKTFHLALLFVSRLPSRLGLLNTQTASLQKCKTPNQTSVLDIWHKTIWCPGSSNAGTLGNAEYWFIAIVPRSPQTWSGGTW